MLRVIIIVLGLIVIAITGVRVFWGVLVLSLIFIIMLGVIGDLSGYLGIYTMGFGIDGLR